ncbi:hypothetical protein [Dissulfuribacter thermophilus]|uniref:hypothetical protein n=1 Tax=Dissulfuribacter thermophilus TaxID=1156395 RepID=UPI000829BDEF|nr:hypothetical protein [Dissulfuribacter thermophilus]
MTKVSDMIKPKGSSKKQLFLAGAMWSLVGIMLFFRGIRWLILNQYENWLIIICILGATVIGLIKGKIILDKAANKATIRIQKRGDDKCLFGFFSWKNWLLIALMITLGRLLRASPAPVYVVSTIYMAIGTALTYSSRIFFTSIYP